jgi:hypothetical protein
VLHCIVVVARDVGEDLGIGVPSTASSRDSFRNKAAFVTDGKGDAPFCPW